MSANYTPNQNEYKNLTPFKYWLVNQINNWGLNNFPFVESDFDELTNYGMLMKMMKALNDVISNQNKVEQDMTNLFNAFTELQTYVNNYFDNLDVQDEINNKLDEMAESGQLADIIAQYLGLAGMIVFNTLSEMKVATNLVNGSKCQTLGYYDVNDGGGACYKVRNITNDDIVDNKFIIALSDDNLIGELIIDDKINIKQIGAYGDNIHDDTIYFESTISYLKNKNGGEMFVPIGTYLINRPIRIASNITLKGNGNGSLIKANSTFTPSNYKSMLILEYMTMDNSNENITKNVNIQNLALDNNSIVNAGYDGIIQYRGLVNGSVRNVNIHANGDNVWGVILFSANKNIKIDNININNDSPDNNLGGCLWIRSGLANIGESTKTTNIDVVNSSFYSTAKDELVCIADGVAGGWTETNISNCDLYGKASTTFSSYGIVVNCIGDNTSKVKANLNNINFRGNFNYAGVVVGSSTTDETTIESTISNLNMNITSNNYGIRSYYLNTIINNCFIKISGVSKSAAFFCTLNNCYLMNRAERCNVYNCYINANRCCENCYNIINNILKGSVDGVHSYGKWRTRIQNNEIECDTNGIYAQAVNNESLYDSIISGNFIKRLTTSSNTGSVGIYGQYTDRCQLVNNIIYCKTNNETGNFDSFQYATNMSNSTNIITDNNTIIYK